MYHENTNQIHLALFILCALSATFSPPYNQSSAQQNVIKEATGSSQSGMVQTVQTWWVTNAKEKPNCWVECKIWMLTGIWIREEIAISLVDNCKALAENPVMCIKVWASIVMNESGGWYKCRKANKYNCFWIMQNEDYKSYHDATLHFAWKFQKWWRNAKDMSFFYSPSWSLPRSRYCTSEDSSGSTIGCPNGLRNSTYYFNKLNF